MIDYQTGLQHIVDGQGVPIAIAGMTIVFSALTFIAAFISVLPRLLRLVATIVPEPTPPAPPPARQPVTPPRSEDDGAALATVAAAAAAYHTARTGSA